MDDVLRAFCNRGKLLAVLRTRVGDFAARLNDLIFMMSRTTEWKKDTNGNQSRLPEYCSRKKDEPVST